MRNFKKLQTLSLSVDSVSDSLDSDSDSLASDWHSLASISAFIINKKNHKMFVKKKIIKIKFKASTLALKIFNKRILINFY